MPSQNGYSRMYKGTHKSIEVQLLTEIDVSMDNVYAKQYKKT